MIEYGRFVLNDIDAQGENFLARALLGDEIGQAVNEGQRLRRVAQSMKESGRDWKPTSDRASALLGKATRLTVEFIETTIVTLDGTPVDMDNEEDRDRVRRALGKLSKEEWEGLTKSLKKSSQADDDEDGDSKSG